MPRSLGERRSRRRASGWLAWVVACALAPSGTAQQPGPQPAATRPQPDAASDTAAPTIHLIGDSTMADKPLRVPNPERGWGQILPVYFRDGVRVLNHAVNGRSTKSFLALGHWQAALERIRPGDYVIVQFGHNDSKQEDPTRFTQPWGDYRRNLERYVSETRGRAALPILATPIVRRHFDAQGALLDRHGDYPKVVRQVAAELQVPLLELHGRSQQLVLRLGPARSELLYLARVLPGEYEKLPDGIEDNTHLSAVGASRICDLAADEIRSSVPALARWLRD